MAVSSQGIKNLKLRSRIVVATCLMLVAILNDFNTKEESWLRGNQADHAEWNYSSPLRFPIGTSERYPHHEAESPTVKKVLWMYWEQGIDHLDSIANSDADSKYKADAHCVQAWKTLNPTWNIRVLNKTEAMKLAPRFALLAGDTRGRVDATHLSDVLRLDLLSQYGGVWSDTSVCPFRPLDSFVHKLVGTEGFFAPHLGKLRGAGDLSGSDLGQFATCHKLKWYVPSKHVLMAEGSRSCNSWFLVVNSEHNLFVDAWLEALVKRYLEILHPKNCAFLACAYPYYLTQCTFTQVRMKNKEVDAKWTRYRLEDNPDQHWALDGENERDGLCNGWREFDSDFAMRRCYFVKRPEGELADFIASQAYLT